MQERELEMMEIREQQKQKQKKVLQYHLFICAGGGGKGISEIIKRNISINKYMIGMQIRREREKQEELYL